MRKTDSNQINQCTYLTLYRVTKETYDANTDCTKIWTEC